MGVQINGSEGNVIATKGTFSGDVGIGGTLTYEDVTNIDSVGLVTARSGIEVGARPGVGASISVDGNAIFSGITTATTLRTPTGIATHFTADKISLPDSGDGSLNIGVGSDFKLSHNGTDSFITEVGGGDLIIQGSDIILRDAGTLEKHIEMTQNGAVDIYHNGTKKFETTSTGISVTGSVSVTTEPAFRAGLINGTTAVASGSGYNIPFDTDSGDGVFDTNGCFDTSTHRFTPNLAGYYFIHLQVRLSLAAAGHIFQARIRNSSDNIIAIANKTSVGAFSDTATVSCLQYFNGSSDYVSAQVYQNSGNSINMAGGTTYHYQTFFEGHFIRSA